jgi:hypothetical protein
MISAGNVKLTGDGTNLDGVSGEAEVLFRLMDTGLLSPDPKYVGVYPTVTGCHHAVAPRSQVSINDAVRRKEVLRLAWRPEPWHLKRAPFDATRRPQT